MIRRVLHDLQKAAAVDAAPAQPGAKEVISVKGGKRKGNMRGGIQAGRSKNARRSPDIINVRKLFVATSTLKRHINNIYAKLDVHGPALREGEGEKVEGVGGLIFDLKHNLHSSHFLIYSNIR